VTGADCAIRAEWPGDRAEVFEVNRRAFASAAEADLVDALRPLADPLVSLVAETGGRVVGHSLFTPVTVPGPEGERQAMALGPLAVLPEFQRRGIGGQLIRAGLEACRDLGQGAVFLLGDSAYYGRFGFAPAAARDLHYKGPEFDPYFMVLELEPSWLGGCSGKVRYLPPFEELGAE
jgi:putative acetyltransferase